MAGIIPPSTPGLDAGKIRTKRVTTGSVAGAGEATVAVTWDSPFADTDYTATVSVVDSSTIGVQVERILTQTASALTVRVHNEDAIGAHTGTLHAVAIHD